MRGQHSHSYGSPYFLLGTETFEQEKGKKMSRFTPEEIAYLQSQRLGRLATINENGDLHVVPVGFRYNPETDTIDIGGHNFATSKKYREALRHGRVAFVVDDVLPPWQPRFIEVRGTVQAISSGGKQIMPAFSNEFIRLRQEGVRRIEQGIGCSLKTAIDLVTKVLQYVKVHPSNAPTICLGEHYSFGPSSARGMVLLPSLV